MKLKEMLNKKIEECLNAKKDNKYIIVEYHDIKKICETLKELGYKKVDYKEISDFEENKSFEERSFTKENNLIILSTIYDNGIVALSKYDTEKLEKYLKTTIKKAKKDNESICLSFEEENTSTIVFALQKIGYNLISMKSEPYDDYKENSYFFMNIKEGNKDVLKLFDDGDGYRTIEWL